MNRTILSTVVLALTLATACATNMGTGARNDGDGDAGAGGSAGAGGGARGDASTSADGGLRTATAIIAPTVAGATVPTGTVTFTQTGTQVLAMVRLEGLTPGMHGIHIHQNGSCEPDTATPPMPAGAAGGHWNPTATKHGGPGSGHRGDFGNARADANGRVDEGIFLTGVTVRSGDVATDVVGHAFVVHMGPDDLITDPAGNSGGRIGCGVIR